MNNVELYQRNNTLQKRDSRQGLEEYANKINWKKYGATIIDIGCGDGGVTTSILKTFIPNNYKIVGCDINEKMVQFANSHRATDSISFRVLDIERELPKQLREKFDHVFSFYALHWINHQEMGFSNIYDLLTKTGDCLLMLVGNSQVFDTYRKLARNPRWSSWLRDVDRYVSPYHDSQDPENEIKRMMTTIGFTDVEVKCVKKIFVYTSIEDFKDAMNAINPFKIPLEMQADFLDDYVKIVRDMQHIDYNDGGLVKVNKNYNVITVYGKK